jgi:signal transduction histidine kinase
VPGIEVQAGSHVGLGLGLFLAREIARELGGRLEVDTAPGAGSTFVVTLPRAASTCS